jgi:hypothetical protein
MSAECPIGFAGKSGKGREGEGKKKRKRDDAGSCPQFKGEFSTGFS